MNTSWHAEKQKTKRRHIWLIPFAFLVFDVLWSFWQLGTASSRDLQSGYLMQYFHLQMMNVILLPVMITVLASRLCDMEIKGDTLKLLYTLQKRTVFYDCKYLAALKYLLLFVSGQGAMILGMGRLYHFKDALKLPLLLEYLVVTFTVSAVLLCAQQFLSLYSDSQILPLVVGLSGSFLGLFSMFFPAPVACLIPWGYYARFSMAAMDWDPDTRISTYYEVPFPWKFFLLFLLSGIIIYMIGRMIISRKEA